MNHSLFLMLGYPGSGKSHFSKQLAKKIKAIRLNSDHLRKHIFDKPEEHHSTDDHPIVFGSLAYAAREALSAGHSVVCDANYNFLKDRQKYAKIAQQLSADAITIWIKTPLEMAIERGGSRELTSEQVRFNEDHIRRVASELEPPCLPDEKCIEIDGTLDFDHQFAMFEEKLNSLKQESAA
jgi:predicted kinase